MRRCVPVLVILSLFGCERLPSGRLAECQEYRRTLPSGPSTVGSGRSWSGTRANEVEVKVYHPDGLGDVELRRRVAPGAVLVLQGEDGNRLALGNDRDVQVEQSCVATLGQAAEWKPGGSPCTGKETASGPVWPPHPKQVRQTQRYRCWMEVL